MKDIYIPRTQWKMKQFKKQQRHNSEAAKVKHGKLEALSKGATGEDQLRETEEKTAQRSKKSFLKQCTVSVLNYATGSL